MLETRARVVEIHSHLALVEANQVSGCEQCNGKGCGSSKVAQLFCSQPRKFQVENSIGAKVGDEVIISVADGAVMRGTLLAYLLPVAMLVLGGMVGSWLANSPEQSDEYVAMGSIANLLIGFAFSRSIVRRLNLRQNQPYISRQWH